MRPRLARVALVTLLALLVSASMATCGGDEDDPGAGGATTSTPDDGPSEEEVEPARWTYDLCTELGSWQDELERLGTELASGLGAATDPRGARDAFVRFIDDSLLATDRMLEGVDDVGTPDIEDGDAFARDIRDGLGGLRQAFLDGRERSEQLPVDDVGVFRAGAEAIGNELMAAGEEARENLESLGSQYDAPDLKSAFAEEPACDRFSAWTRP